METAQDELCSGDTGGRKLAQNCATRVSARSHGRGGPSEQAGEASLRLWWPSGHGAEERRLQDVSTSRPTRPPPIREEAHFTNACRIIW